MSNCPTWNGRHPVEAQVRPLVIVEPDEAFHRPIAMPEGPAALERQALVVDRPKEALDLAVGLRTARSEQMMDDAQAPTALLESGQPIAVQGATHGEREGVVRQHGFHAI